MLEKIKDEILEENFGETIEEQEPEEKKKIEALEKRLKDVEESKEKTLLLLGDLLESIEQELRRTKELEEALRKERLRLFYENVVEVLRDNLIDIVTEGVKKARKEWSGIYSFPLDKARDGEQIGMIPEWGDCIVVKKLDGEATLRVDTTSGTTRSFTLTENKRIKLPFRKLYLTNTAQSGKELVLLIGKGDLELDRIVETKRTKAFAYESITVSNTAVGFTPSVYNPTGHKAQVAFVTCEDASIRFRIDGTAPTASEGHLLNSGDSTTIEGYENIKNFKAIRTGASNATLRVTYEE